ncbi:hypothetical protein Pcinc_003908 [Petrolisthes cinctipes]|uniref:AAA+ ATPase domain-containing protein n=1 Tax=Petrolisthes cinctipes TaxID=88211 RepID=A0AAE1GFK3_PETCI|nr:hypothetical protein Pcinc_003908 [Petrolisthes cinctipes]
MQGKTENKSLGCNTSLQQERSYDPPTMTSVVTLTSYDALPDKVRCQLSGVRSLSVGLSPSQATNEGIYGLYVTLTHPHTTTTTTTTTTYPARLLLHKSFKDSVTIIHKDAVSDLRIAEGDEVTVCGESECLLAQDVTLSLLTNMDLSDSTSFTSYLREQLVNSGLIICTGMNIVVQYLSQEVTLKVISVKLFGLQVTVPFRVINQTQVHVEITKDNTDSGDDVKSELSFENIGGYQAEIQEIQQQTDMFFSYGVTNTKPVRGILISGPAGSGKSLILEALQTKYGNKCVSVNQEDVKSRYRGETEQNIKQCFTVAANRAPCLLLMDDVDVLCGGAGVERGSGGGSRAGRGGSGSGVVTALLHFMDGLSSSSVRDIMVVGTVRHPESIDAALRRPGRLSCDIILPVPDASSRVDILTKLLDGVTHDLGEEDLEELGERTPGYFGGDLRSVVVEGVIEAGTGTLTSQHIQAALHIIKPIALRNTTTLISQTKMSDLVGYGDLKSKVQEAVSLTLVHGSVFQQCGLASPSHFLLFGPPGCGKTALVRAVASQFHMSVVPVRRATVLGKYFGESEQNLARIFSQASASAPCIVHFENFEGLGGRRTGFGDEGGGTDVESRIINHLKVQLDGIVRSQGIFIFAETSRPDLLDTDLIRPGRFHEYHEVGLPDTADRLQLLHQQLSSNHHLAPDINFHTLVHLTQSLTVAEVLQVCDDVKQLAREAQDPTSNTEVTLITAQSVAQVVEAVIPSTSLKMCHKYKNFSNIYCSGS